ncbi:MAG: type II secretory pathway pseudopilin PulG [Rickettsiales bacterium]|jgi:type II secretory pathway pseudopilin PulG
MKYPVIHFFNKKIMQKNRKNKLAFSLIEISIVIIVIGILVIGITKGSKIIKKSKITSAQSLTINSPVASIEGLAFWLESTLDASFVENAAVDTDLGDDGTITVWNDINPHAPIKKNATQGSTALAPRYIADGINGLPVVNFDGDNNGGSSENAGGSATRDFMILPTAEDLGLVESDWEIFIVYQIRNYSVSDHAQFLIAGSDSRSYEIHSLYTGFLRVIADGDGNLADYPDSTITNQISPHIASGAVRGTSSIARLDGGGDNADTNDFSPKSSESGNLIIGRRGDASFPLNGDIGEVIIFNRSLNNFERDGVEEYLSAKWGIELQ